MSYQNLHQTPSKALLVQSKYFSTDEQARRKVSKGFTWLELKKETRFRMNGKHDRTI